MVSIKDPLKGLPTAREVLEETRAQTGASSAAEVAGVRKLASKRTTKAELAARAKADFRVFLILVWRFLLGVDPSPIQLDMAHWLQRGPDRSIIMAFRGFSKSWITGAYGVWRLWNDPEEKVLVVSGSANRAQASTQWCLALINGMDILKELRPKPSNRQSASMFDVGNCRPAQSASFMAMGIGGQIVGFRATCIIPDDVETQTNSETVTMRDKVRERVKEFESVLVPGGVIKYLGTPHDIDSLYLFLLGLRNDDGTPVYTARIWPGRFPSIEQQKAYGPWLAPYILKEMQRLGPGCIGKSTMPNRFTDEDLAKREAAIGKNEFSLQFMLDLRGLLKDKYPLKLRNLIVMPLDDRMGPEEVAWGTGTFASDVPLLGFDGDFLYRPAYVGEKRLPWQRVVAFLDPSGKGKDETSLSVVALLHGRVFLLYQYNSLDGFSAAVLLAIARACVRFGVHELHYETAGLGATFGPLLRPYIEKAWSLENAGRLKENRRAELGGTSLVEAKSPTNQKERRVLGVLEPITQQHRLVIAEEVLKEDHSSVQRIDGTENRRAYTLGYQYTRLTDEKDCLLHDDRVDSLAGACAIFADQLGVDPSLVAAQSAEERFEAELAALFEDDEEIGGGGFLRRTAEKIKSMLPSKR